MKTEFVYVTYPVVHYHFHLAGSCLHRCYSHISSKCVSLFSSQIIIILEQDSTPHPKITAFTEGKGLTLPTECRAPVRETTGSLPPLCSACDGPPAHITPEVIATHRCCLSQSRLAFHLPFQNSTSKSSDAIYPTLLLPGDWSQSFLAHENYVHRNVFTNTFPKTFPDHHYPADSPLHFFPLYKSPFKTSLILISDLGGVLMAAERKRKSPN